MEMHDENRAAKMQFLPVVGNAFLRNLVQPYFKKIAGFGFFMFLKKGCRSFNTTIYNLLNIN